MEDANRRPHRKAMTTAPPRRSRELVEDIRDVSRWWWLRSIQSSAAPGFFRGPRYFVTYKCIRGSLYGASRCSAGLPDHLREAADPLGDHRFLRAEGEAHVL